MKRTLKYLYAIRDKLRETVIVDPEEIADKLVFFHDKNGLIHFPVNINGQVPIIDVPYESDIKHFKRQCTNDASNAGNHSIKIEPAANSIVLIYFASIVNNDAADRAGYMHIYTAGGVSFATLNMQATMSTDVPVIYPTLGTGGRYITPGRPLILTDAFEILMQVSAVAVSEESSYFLMYSVIGDAPTITETGPTGSVWADIA